MLGALRDAARRLGLPGQRVLVAVSGGLDSTALLHGLVRLARELELELRVGHVDHGLRAGSAADAAFVCRLAAKLDLPVDVARVDPEALRRGRASRERPTLQEAARRSRYRALEAQAEASGAVRIATAHHRDDQAETLLLRLLRGAGPDGLGGIPERSPDGRVVRPLLEVPRTAIRAYAEVAGLEWREDPSNASARFARARLRSRWLPGLAADFNPQLLRALGDLAEAARRDAEWIDACVEREAAGRFRGCGAAGLAIVRTGWDAVPEALARRLARRALGACGAGRDVSRTHLLRVVSFWRNPRTGARIELPGGLVLRCEQDRFLLGPAGAGPPAAC